MSSWMRRLFQLVQDSLRRTSTTASHADTVQPPPEPGTAEAGKGGIRVVNHVVHPPARGFDGKGEGGSGEANDALLAAARKPERPGETPREGKGGDGGEIHAKVRAQDGRRRRAKTGSAQSADEPLLPARLGLPPSSAPLASYQLAAASALLSPAPQPALLCSPALGPAPSGRS